MWLVLFLLAAGIVIYLASRIRNLESRLQRMERVSQPQQQPDLNRLAALAPQPPARPDGAAGPTEHLEFQLGSRVFTWIGAAAVLAGVGFFLLYAFEQGLITEEARVALGLIAGSLLLLGGGYLGRRYPGYGTVLQGLGLGVYYLTFYAAHSLYGFFGLPMALGLIAATLAGAATLAVRKDSRPLAGVAAFGAYLTPLAFDLSAMPHLTLGSLLLINAALLLLAVRQKWHGLMLGGLLGTAVVYSSWHAQFYQAPLMATAAVYLAGNYLAFLAPGIFNNFLRRQAETEPDLALTALNPAFHFLAAYAVFSHLDTAVSGWIALGLALTYALLGTGIKQGLAATVHYGVSAVLLFAALPLLLDGNWVVAGWAALGGGLVYFGLTGGYRLLQGLGHAALMTAAVRLGLIEIGRMDEPGFAGTTLTLVLVLAIFWWTYAACSRYQQDPQSRGLEQGREVLALQAHLLLLWWLSQAVALQPDFGRHLTGGLWALASCAAVWAGLKGGSGGTRRLGYATALLAFFLLTAATNGSWENQRLLLNERFLGFALAVAGFGGIALLTSRRKEQLMPDEAKHASLIMAGLANLAVLWVISLETSDHFNRLIAAAEGDAGSLQSLKRAALSVAWSLYAAGLLVIGIICRSAFARLCGIALLGASVFKVFLYDTQLLSNFHRFLSFFSLGAILLLAGYLYNRYKDRIVEFIQVKQDNV